MMYVGVRHKKTHPNLWWFYVPNSLKGNVELGATAVCDTRKGRQKGKIIEIRDGITETDALRLSNGNFIRPITGVTTEISLVDILIPDKFAQTMPKREKIAKRIHEFCNLGRFKTKIEVNKKNMLTNGYTAYLAAKRIGRKTLECFKTA